MMDSILKKGDAIKAIKPLAYSREMYGINLLVEVQRLGKEIAYAFLMPPHYSVNEFIPHALVQAAISKYAYTPLENQPFLASKAELENFLKNL